MVGRYSKVKAIEFGKGAKIRNRPVVKSVKWAKGPIISLPERDLSVLAAAGSEGLHGVFEVRENEGGAVSKKNWLTIIQGAEVTFGERSSSRSGQLPAVRQIWKSPAGSGGWTAQARKAIKRREARQGDALNEGSDRISDGDNIGPYAWCEKFARGEIQFDSLIEFVTEFKFLDRPAEWSLNVDFVGVNSHTWQEVEEAFMDGLIDRSQYDVLLSTFIKGRKVE